MQVSKADRTCDVIHPGMRLLDICVCRLLGQFGFAHTIGGTYCSFLSQSISAFLSSSVRPVIEVVSLVTTLFRARPIVASDPAKTSYGAPGP